MARWSDRETILLQLSRAQIYEIRESLRETIDAGKEPPEWLVKGGQKIVEILSAYPLFASYKHMISELVWYAVTNDHEFRGPGLDKEEFLAFAFLNNPSEVLQTLKDNGLISLTEEGKISVGPVLSKVSDVINAYGSGFNSAEWSNALLMTHLSVFLAVAEDYLNKAIRNEARMPRMILAVFYILSTVLMLEKNSPPEELSSKKEFRLPEIYVLYALHVFKSKRQQRYFIQMISGVTDGVPKLFENILPAGDYHEFILHRDLNDYIVHMIERERENERASR